MDGEIMPFVLSVLVPAKTAMTISLSSAMAENAPAPDIDVAAVFDELEPQLFDWADPPPSKAAFELVPGHGMISGLTPDVLISVEPSGMPPRPDELESSGEFAVDGAPSGEVGPMPGVGLVCACAATIPIQ